MLIPDVNILIYAYNSSLQEHKKAKKWFEDCLNGTEIIGMSPVAVMGFIRILSNPRIVDKPGKPAGLAEIAGSWFSQPSVRSIAPGPDYPEIMENIFSSTGASGRMTTDIFLSALAISLDAVICSNDSDFQRIPGIKIVNPLTV